MSGRISKRQQEQIRKISIHRLLGKVNNGRRINMPCPIHNGHNPMAFHLYPDNTYHCFNCGAHGSGAIDFVKDWDGCDYKKAVEQLSSYL
jgi:DNA primase